MIWLSIISPKEQVARLIYAMRMILGRYAALTQIGLKTKR